MEGSACASPEGLLQVVTGSVVLAVGIVPVATVRSGTAVSKDCPFQRVSTKTKSSLVWREAESLGQVLSTEYAGRHGVRKLSCLRFGLEESKMVEGSRTLLDKHLALGNMLLKVLQPFNVELANLCSMI